MFFGRTILGCILTGFVCVLKWFNNMMRILIILLFYCIKDAATQGKMIISMIIHYNRHVGKSIHYQLISFWVVILYVYDSKCSNKTSCLRPRNNILPTLLGSIIEYTILPLRYTSVDTATSIWFLQYYCIRFDEYVALV